MDIQSILDIQDELIKDPSLAPANGTTYCNFSVQKYLGKFGYTKLNGLMANEMVDYMLLHFQEWQKLQDGDHAKQQADLGEAVIAGHKYEPHGHVSIVRPGCPLVYSGHWNIDCPMLSNVGERNGILAANFVFPVADTPPDYFRLLV